MCSTAYQGSRCRHTEVWRTWDIFLLIHDAVVGAFATGRTEAGTRLALWADITDTGKLTGLAPHTVVERTSVNTSLPENHVGTNLLGDSGAIFTYLLTNLLERFPVIQTSLNVRAVFVTQMTILGHQVLLFWSEQQVVNQR